MSANERFETLGDIARKGANLAVGCTGCGRRAVISGEWLGRMFLVRHWDGRVSAIARHLRCGRCGARPDVLRVTRQRPTIDRPPRSEAEWRRLAARLRG